MADFLKGVYPATITAQSFRVQEMADKAGNKRDVWLFTLDCTIDGFEDPETREVKPTNVKRGSVDLFMTEDQLGPAPAPEPGKKAKARTVDILRHLGCAGLSFRQLDPTNADHKKLAGTKVRLWGYPQDSNPQYGRFKIMVDTPRAPRESAKGAGNILDSLFRGALGKPEKPKVEDTPKTESKPQLPEGVVDEGSGDDLPF